MKTKIYKKKRNLSAVRKKAAKAGADTGLITGLIGAAIGMFIGYAMWHGNNNALLGAMIIGPLAAIVSGTIRAIYVWNEFRLSVKRQLIIASTLHNAH